MSNDIEQALPLLEDDAHEMSTVNHGFKSTVLPRRPMNNVTFLLALYALVISGVVLYQNFVPGPKAEPYSPASHIVQYEYQRADPDKHTIYSEAPSPEVDAAWGNLVHPIYFSATHDEIESSKEDPDDSVRLHDTDDYLGTLGVYHGLHCMRRLYWHLNEETYFPNRTAETHKSETGHALHCLGVIVRELQCMPNTALYTFGFDPVTEGNVHLKSGAHRKCIKWEPFHQWALDRSPGYYPRLRGPLNLLRELGNVGDDFD